MYQPLGSRFDGGVNRPLAQWGNRLADVVKRFRTRPDVTPCVYYDVTWLIHGNCAAIHAKRRRKHWELITLIGSEGKRSNIFVDLHLHSMCRGEGRSCWCRFSCSLPLNVTVPLRSHTPSYACLFCIKDKNRPLIMCSTTSLSSTTVATISDPVLPPALGVSAPSATQFSLLPRVSLHRQHQRAHLHLLRRTSTNRVTRVTVSIQGNSSDGEVRMLHAWRKLH